MKTFRSLRSRNYRLYFFGQMISLTGSWMQTTSLMWLAQEMTGEAKWPAILIAMQIGPTLFLGAWGGILADRLPRRPLIAVTQLGFLGCALTYLLLYSLGILPMEVMLAITLLQGILQAVDLPARLAFVPTLVPREDLANAVSLNSLLFNTARAIGPAVAGLVMAYHSAAWCFAANAISYFAFFLGLYLMKLPPDPHIASTTRHRGSFGLLSQYPTLGWLIAVAGLVAVGGWPLLSLLPFYSVIALNSGKETYSLLMSAVGVGAFFSALTTASFSSERWRRKLLILGLTIVMSALSVFPLLTDADAAAVCCGCFGFGMIMFFATGQSIVQLGIDDGNRGKIMGIWAMILSAGVPIGNLVFGPLVDWVGLRPVLVAQTVVVGLALLALLIISRRVLARVSPFPDGNP